jgi:ubiquinone/menaquinone biosynthesis C-methylase UbiE
MKYTYYRMGFRRINMGNNKKANLYRVTASLYDFDQRNITKDDISFYLEYATKLHGSILELACGTGRVTIP